MTFWSTPERLGPLFLIERAQEKLNKLSLFTNEMYIFGLLAAVATSLQLRDELRGRRAILCGDNDAACAALAKGAANSRLALTLVHSTVAAGYDLAMWTGRAPSKRNPADLPSRGQEIPFATERRGELATLADMFAWHDSSRMLPGAQ